MWPCRRGPRRGSTARSACPEAHRATQPARHWSSSPSTAPGSWPAYASIPTGVAACGYVAECSAPSAPPDCALKVPFVAKSATNLPFMSRRRLPRQRARTSPTAAAPQRRPMDRSLRCAQEPPLLRLRRSGGPWAAPYAARRNRPSTRVPKRNASRGTRSSTPWNSAPKLSAGGSRNGAKP